MPKTNPSLQLGLSSSDVRSILLTIHPTRSQVHGYFMVHTFSGRQSNTMLKTIKNIRFINTAIAPVIAPTMIVLG